MSYMFVPIKSKTSLLSPGFTDPDELYTLLKDKFSFSALGRDDYYIDYQNIYTFAGVQNLRNMGLQMSEIFRADGHDDRALEALDTVCRAMRNFPMVTSLLGLQANDYAVTGIIRSYLELGRNETAIELAEQTGEEILQGINFFLSPYTYSSDTCELLSNMYYIIADMLKEAGETAASDAMLAKLEDLLG